MKSVRIRKLSGPGWIRTENSVSLRIQFECGKIRIRKTSDTDTFHAVVTNQSNAVQAFLFIIIIVMVT